MIVFVGILIGLMVAKGVITVANAIILCLIFAAIHAIEKV